MNSELNTRAKKIRLALKITQREAADLLNVSPPYYSDIENGRRSIGKKFFDKFCKTFNVNADWMHTEKGNVFLEKGNFMHPKNAPLYIGSEKGATLLSNQDVEIEQEKLLEKQNRLYSMLNDYLKHNKTDEILYKSILQLSSFQNMLSDFFREKAKNRQLIFMRVEMEIKDFLPALKEFFTEMEPYKEPISKLMEAAKPFLAQLAKDEIPATSYIHTEAKKG